MIFLPDDKTYQNMKKIDTYNLLNRMGFPVLKSILLDENEVIDKEKEEIIKSYLNSNFCTIRYQYIVPNCRPLVGGNKIKITDFNINKFSQNGTKLWLLEPVDRLKNLYGFSILIRKNIQTEIEIVGRGFDGSDLNRGNVNPHQIIYLDNPIRKGYNGEWWKFIKVVLSSHDEFDLSKKIRLKKLNKLMDDILNEAIFDNKYKPMPYSILEKIIEYIEIFQKSDCEQFVVAGSVLNDGKIIFWDIHYPQDKIKIYKEKEVKENERNRE